MSTIDFFNHEVVEHNSSVSPVENLATEVSEAFEKVSEILNSQNIVPNISSIIGNYLLSSINYHGTEEDYEETFSITELSKDIVLKTSPLNVISVSYYDSENEITTFLTAKNSDQLFTDQNQYKILGKVIHLSGNFNNISLKVKYKGTRNSIGGLNLRPNVIQNTDGSYTLPLSLVSGTTYKVTYDVNLQSNINKYFGASSIDTNKLFLVAKDTSSGNYFNISFTSAIIKNNTIEFNIEDLDKNYNVIVFYLNVTISAFLEALYKEFISHNHSSNSSTDLVKHSSLIDLYKNTDIIFYKDVNTSNYEHPQFLNREGYNPSLSQVYENSMLGDLFLAAKITDLDQTFKSLTKNSYSLLFGDPNSGSKLYFDNSANSLNILSGTNLNGLNIDVSNTKKALSINKESYIQETSNYLKIRGKNNTVQVSGDSTNPGLLKSDLITGLTSVSSPLITTNNFNLGNTKLHSVTNNLTLDKLSEDIETTFNSDITFILDVLKANVINSKVFELDNNSKIKTSDTSYIQNSNGSFVLVSDKEFLIKSSGKNTGLSIGKEATQEYTMYTSDSLGQQSTSLDTNLYMETPDSSGLFLIQSTSVPFTKGTTNYTFQTQSNGSTRIDSLKDWKRSNIFVGEVSAYNINVNASDSISRNGLKIGSTRLSSIGSGLDCPEGMTLIESSDAVSIIKTINTSLIDCSQVQYQSLNAGNTQIFGNLSVDENLNIVGNLSVGSDLLADSITIEDTVNTENINVTGKSVFRGTSEFNNDVVLNSSISVVGTISTNSSLEANDLNINKYLIVGTTLSVKGQVDFGNNLIVQGQIQTNGGLKSAGPLEADSLKTSEISTQELKIAGNLQVQGGTSLTGPLELTGNTLITGNAKLEGSIDISSSLTAGSLYSIGDTVLQGRLTVDDSAIFDNNITAEGQIYSSTGFQTTGYLISETLRTSEIISQTIKATNGLQVQGPTLITGEMNVVGSSTVVGNQTIEGNLEVTTNITADSAHIINDTNIQGRLDVLGQVRFNDDLSVDGELTVKNNTQIDGMLTVDSVTTDLITSKSITATGGLNIQGRADFTGPLKLVGSLDVTGNQNIIGSSSISSQLSAGSLLISNDSVLQGRLTVNGPVVMENNSVTLGTATATVQVKGNTTLDGSVTTITGDLRLFQNLTVVGTVSLGKTLTVADIISSTNLKISGAAEVQGILKGSSAEFSRKVYLGEGFQAQGDSTLVRLRATEINTSILTSDEVLINDTLTMGPEAKLAANNIEVSSITQTSSTTPSRFAGDIQIPTSSIILGNAGIVNSRASQGTLITGDEIRMGPNSSITTIKYYANKGVPTSGNNNTTAGYCFTSATATSGVDGDTGMFATNGTGSGVDGSNIEFWIDGVKRAIIPKNDVPYSDTTSTNQQVIATIAMLKAAIADMESRVSLSEKAVLERVYPIGSVYINAEDTRNPYLIFGIGTWVRYAAGRTIVGQVDSAVTGGQISGGLSAPSSWSVTTIGSTYGNYTHKLTSAQLPSRSNRYLRATMNTGGDLSIGNIDGNGPVRYSVWENGDSVGGDEEHNNTQPSIIAAIWKRIA